MSLNSRNTIAYGRFLLFIAGMGGLLYGVDVGMIAAALLYLDKTINLTMEQTATLVAAVLFGGMISSLMAGALADWFGRRRMMIIGGAMFVTSLGIVVISNSFIPLFVGRLLQGMSSGAICLVIPLYLAECLSAKTRGKGTAIFQFMLTFGIVAAALTGLLFTRHAEASIAAAAGNPVLIEAAQNFAWRGMFSSVLFAGLIFLVGTFALSESPRWLLRRGRDEAALAALRRSCPAAEVDREMSEMRALAAENPKHTAIGFDALRALARRKYVVPFVLACFALSLNQCTGINCVLSYLVIILKQAGMTVGHATQGDVAVKLLNCLITIAAVMLVDRKGRKFLLTLGTGAIVVALLAAGFIFHGFESQRRNVRTQVQSAVHDGSVTLPVSEAAFGPAVGGRPMVLTVLYFNGTGNHIVTVLSNDADPVLTIAAADQHARQLVIKLAQYGPVPTERTGWLITAALMLFIAGFSVGPGVVGWLVLSELMPTRIRAMGMGVALVLNQGISTLMVRVFLPVVGNYGYYAIFFFWAGCTLLYFLTAAFVIPETKGRSLEEIEVYFDKGVMKAEA